MDCSTILDDRHTVKEKIHAMMPAFSKGQKRIAEYILKNYDTAAFLTAAKLGEKAGVSESTAVRFAMLLGYEGYPEFQEAMAAFLKKRLGSVEKIEAASGDIEQSKVLSYVMSADIEKIRLTMDTIEPDAFELAVDMLNTAEHIYVVGVRSCAPLAEFLGFYLRMVHDNVRMVTTNSASEMFEQMLSLNERDVISGMISGMVLTQFIFFIAVPPSYLPDFSGSLSISESFVLRMHGSLHRTECRDIPGKRFPSGASYCWRLPILRKASQSHRQVVWVHSGCLRFQESADGRFSTVRSLFVEKSAPAEPECEPVLRP